MTKKIDIADLLNPQLSDMQKGAIAHFAANPVELSEKAVLDEAKKRTGLSDFGPDDFRVRLGLLLDEWNADTNMLQLNRFVLLQMAQRLAANRLITRDYLKKHPEVHAEVIEKPIIVVGLPRSGTTHLLNLLGSDTRLRSLPLWEAMEPLPNPAEAPRADGVDPRWQRCEDQWQGALVSSPLTAAMHPMNPDHFHEDLELMCPDFASYNFDWMSRVPGWRDYHCSHDQTPHYEYMKTMFKVLQYGKGPTRWVNKCPQHLEQLPVLKKVFPDALVVLTVRDPVDAIQSAATMMGYAERMRYPKIDAQGLIEYWSDRVDRLLSASIRDRNVWPAEQLVEVPFEPFMRDPMAVVRKVHAKAGMETTAQSVREMEDFVAAHPRGKYGQVVYNLERDFGVSRKDLRKRFQYYFDAYPELKVDD